MELQRLNKKELEKEGRRIFAEYLASSEDFFIGGQLEPCTKEYPTVMDMLYKEHLDNIEETKNRIKMYEEAIEDNKENATCVAALKKQLTFLEYYKHGKAKAKIQRNKSYRLYKKRSKNPFG